MVAIQFKCTYKQYRKLTVWHKAAKKKSRKDAKKAVESAEQKAAREL